AALKGHLAMVALLLAHGADVKARNALGGTPLHDAALSGQTGAATLLLEHGAEVNAPDQESGATPLYLAAAWGRMGLVELLLTAGANPGHRNRAGLTPLDAARKIHDEAVSRAIVELLRSRGAE
ncbi:MAG: ankyrin repeat domain-containing protein, partial [Acidobacteria bacterium]|nr:ankyrin repeat domain-containing protein [Acidobacteriota bacterium]